MWEAEMNGHVVGPPAHAGRLGAGEAFDDGLPVPIMMVDARGRVVHANQSAAGLFRIPLWRLLETPVLDLVAYHDRDRVARRLMQPRSVASWSQLHLTRRDREALPCRVWMDSPNADLDPESALPTVRWLILPGEPPSAELVGEQDALLAQLSGLPLEPPDQLIHLAEILCNADAGSSVVVKVESRSDIGRDLLLCTDPLAKELIDLEDRLGEGPRIEACASSASVMSQDLTRDHRWPSLVAEIARSEALGAGDDELPCVAMPLTVEGEVAATLTWYRRRPWDSRSGHVATAIAAVGHGVLRHLVTREAPSRTSDQYRQALESRAVIDQAKGMIMQALGCNPDEAFALLVRLSNDHNRKLRDLATAIVNRGLDPALPSCSSS